MSTSNRHHVVPHENGWAVRREGSERVSTVTRTKDHAISLSLDIAERARGGVVIHRENGTIQEERTYGDDPFPPCG